MIAGMPAKPGSRGAEINRGGWQSGAENQPDFAEDHWNRLGAAGKPATGVGIS